MVDGRSFLVLHLSSEEARDSTAWGATFLNLQARGIQFQDLASDGAIGIQAGVQEARITVPLRPDLFHTLAGSHALGPAAGMGCLSCHLRRPSGSGEPNKRPRPPDVVGGDR